MRCSLSWFNKDVRGSVRVGLSCVLASLVVVPVCVWAAAPAWWAERGVVNPTAQPDDFAIVNQGQVKHFARQAYNELKARWLIDPAAAEASADPNDPSRILFLAWDNPQAGSDDYLAVNIGQLKHVAKPFYDRLRQLGYTSTVLPAGQDYPWSNASQSADDYALANIGQVKYLFSFEVSALSLTLDSDDDGLLNGWEATHGLNPLDPTDALLDGDGDGWDNLMEYRLGQSPTFDERGTNPRLAAGGDQSLWINSAGLLYVAGRNSHGQLGVGDAVDRTQLAAVSGFSSPVVAAAWGEAHGLGITQNCQVYSWGDNYLGQLGDGTQVSRRAPAVVAGLTKIVRVAAGDHHSLALRGDGTVWVWGGNQRGQLGDGSTTTRLLPVMVAGLSQIVDISAGADFSMALGADGRVWVWGSNDFGQSADDSVSERLVPAEVTGLGLSAKIAAGRHHILVLERTGALRSWGANQAGQLGIGSRTGQSSPQLVTISPGVRSISAGGNHSAALALDGTVWTWGANDLGQLGDGSVDADDPLPAATDLVNIIEIASGRAHALALRQNGELVGWGLNHRGQLGAPVTEPVRTPVQIITPQE
jgi:alpha-tubulin suppressor-like RCC1 family protein